MEDNSAFREGTQVERLRVVSILSQHMLEAEPEVAELISTILLEVVHEVYLKFRRRNDNK